MNTWWNLSLLLLLEISLATIEVEDVPSIAPTNFTPSMPMASSITLSAVAYAVSLSVSSGMVTVTVAVFEVMVGIIVIPMFTTPITATTKSTTDTTRGNAL